MDGNHVCKQIVLHALSGGTRIGGINLIDAWHTKRNADDRDS